MKYYSQTKQDEYLDINVFKKKESGFFLDIGAHDGITYSNTCFFEKNRNWKGICIEPLPNVFQKLKENRNCLLINGGLGEENKIEKFLKIEGYSEMLSGLSKNYNEEHLKRIEKELKEHGGNKTEIEIQCYNINTLLKETNINSIDYCSIDVEGSEFEIIKTFDFNNIDVKVFSIENNYNDSKIRNFLKEKGYELFTILGADDIFIHKEFIKEKKITNNDKLTLKKTFSYLKKMYHKGLKVFKKDIESKDIEMKKYVLGHIKNNFNIIEAGAHNGSDTIELANLTVGNVYAFEPVPELFSMLLDKTKSYKNVICKQLALSDKIDKIQFFISSGTSDGASSALKPKEVLNFHNTVEFKNTINIDTITIDNFCNINKIDKIHFLWLDLQGYEHQALLGASEILKNVEYVFSEVSLIPLYENSLLYGDFKKFMLSKGFDVKKEFLFYKDAGNVLFEKKSRLTT